MPRLLLILMLVTAQVVLVGQARYQCLSGDGSVCCIDSGPSSCGCCDHRAHVADLDDAGSRCESGDCLHDHAPPMDSSSAGDQDHCSHRWLGVIPVARVLRSDDSACDQDHGGLVCLDAAPQAGVHPYVEFDSFRRCPPGVNDQLGAMQCLELLACVFLRC